jgi:hypothetical protein
MREVAASTDEHLDRAHRHAGRQPVRLRLPYDANKGLHLITLIKV